MASTADRWHGPKKKKERELAEAAAMAEMEQSLGDKAERLRGSASLDYPSIAAGTSATLTIAVAGAEVEDDVTLHHTAAPPTSLTFVAWVSAPGTVTVRAYNRGITPLDPPAIPVRVSVWKV